MVNITKSRLDKRKFLPHLEIIDEENKPGKGKNDTLDRSSNDQLQQINAELIRVQNAQNSSTLPQARGLDAVVLNHNPRVPHRPRRHCRQGVISKVNETGHRSSRMNGGRMSLFNRQLIAKSLRQTRALKLSRAAK